MGWMTGTIDRRNGRSAADDAPTGEWSDYRQDAARHRRELERTLRRQLLHDPRAAVARLHNVAPRDIADEAITWALGEWRSKPTGTAPDQWTRKRALQILDESLDREALAAESRDEERREETRLHAQEILADEEERARWMEMLDGEESDPPVPFEGLAADDDVSSVESRLAATEMLGELDRALGRLPEVRRRAVVHHFLDDLAIDDVAYLLDLPASEVETEIAAGMKSLRLALSPRG